MTRSGLPVVRHHADSVLLFDPTTGEMVNPTDATTDTLAAIRDELRDYDETAKIAKQTIDLELLSRMDKAGEWTAYVGGYKLSAPSPEPATEYDGKALYHALYQLHEDGVIDLEAVLQAVEITTTYRPVKAKLNKLRKLGGRVRDVIDAHAREVDKTRRVSVKRGAAA